MRAKKQPAVRGGRHAGQSKNLKFKIQPDLTPGTIEKSIKSWVVDLLAGAHFDGADTLEHRWAKRFWARSGRRLRSV